ncbi:MAG TPA: alcohol dehydrogenase catalytic domain-containing protein [Candidatus Acidoferrales bacterium]|nr:alcohol dehydrogenase catalytic domain-containing protein [Candidatus Acidoferrales bacterium]
MADTNAQMTAAVLYGCENVRVEQVPIPRIAPDEVLVRVEVALTCGTDLKVWKRGYHARMITPPALFGHELAGTVVQAGSEVRTVRVGARVVPSNSAPCGECFYCRAGQANLCEDLLFNNGAYAQFLRVPGRIVQRNLLEIPEHVSFRDAAMAEPLACVLRGVEEMRVPEGATTAVIGCGAIGLKFIRVLSRRGARVIALGKRPSQLHNARKLGAAETIDVTQTLEPVEAVRRLTPGSRGADAVVEAVGLPATWEWAIGMVRRGGSVNLFGGCSKGAEVRMDPSELHYSEITIRSTFHHTPRHMREALASIAGGEVDTGEFITAERPLVELPRIFEEMKSRNGELKTAVIP